MKHLLPTVITFDQGHTGYVCLSNGLSRGASQSLPVLTNNRTHAHAFSSTFIDSLSSLFIDLLREGANRKTRPPI
jgi:hypothetical protein